MTDISHNSEHPSGALYDVLPLYLAPFPYLGCLADNEELSLAEFWEIGKEWLSRHPGRSKYVACYITSAGLDEYSETGELAIHTAIAHNKKSGSKKSDRILDKKLEAAIKYCVLNLKDNGIEAVWDSKRRDGVFYVGNQIDMEHMSYDGKAGKLRETIVAGLFAEAYKIKALGDNVRKYIELLEVVVKGGLDVWMVDSKEVAAVFGFKSAMLISMEDLQNIIDIVSEYGYAILEA